LHEAQTSSQPSLSSRNQTNCDNQPMPDPWLTFRVSRQHISSSSARQPSADHGQLSMRTRNRGSSTQVLHQSEPPRSSRGRSQSNPPDRRHEPAPDAGCVAGSGRLASQPPVHRSPFRCEFSCAKSRFLI
jgi:hypothetical protein